MNSERVNGSHFDKIQGFWNEEVSPFEEIKNTNNSYSEVSESKAIKEDLYKHFDYIQNFWAEEINKFEKKDCSEHFKKSSDFYKEEILCFEGSLQGDEGDQESSSSGLRCN